MAGEEEGGGAWETLHEPLLFSVLCGLGAREVLAAGATCSRWLAASRDGPLWRRLLCRDFSLPLASTRLRPAAAGWMAEYRRLVEDSPCVAASELRGHSDEVLHVSFSHAGDQFVTCSKDGFVLVWSVPPDTLVPALRCSRDMKEQDWQFTWGSRYSPTDSLLLVAGVIDENGVNGEIAVLDAAQDYAILCRVENNPYDVMGSWCDDSSWLSGRMSDLFGEDPCAVVRLCRLERAAATQEGGDSVPGLDAGVTRSNVLKVRSERFDGTNYLRCLMVSDRDLLPRAQGQTEDVFGSYQSFLDSHTADRLDPQEPEPAGQALLAGRALCLVFLCGDATSVPHQIGFKRLHAQDLASVPVITAPDRTIELAGHIVGLAMARDGRHLYANVRRWPAGAQPQEDEPPPIAQEIEMVVVDLATLELLPSTFTGHRGYTDSQGAFYIYLDTGPLLVASGSEDHEARVWDRYYGCRVARLPHAECVNCVAFCPAMEGLLVTVSDDKTVKVWTSRALQRSRAPGGAWPGVRQQEGGQGLCSSSPGQGQEVMLSVS